MTDKPMTVVDLLESVDFRIQRRLDQFEAIFFVNEAAGHFLKEEENFLSDIGLDIQQLKEFLREGEKDIS